MREKKEREREYERERERERERKTQANLLYRLVTLDPEWAIFYHKIRCLLYALLQRIFS